MRAEKAAASPEFAYSEEKWASLKDNRLEFDEIGDLIHEYNTTVLKNNLEYQEYKGKSSSDIAKEYYNSAEDVLENIQYPEDDSSNYASQLSSALNSQQQAEKMVEQGDNNVDDGDIKKLGYQQQEAQLVEQAQGLMINYWTQIYSLESLSDRVTQAESSYQSVVTKKQAGMATQADVEICELPEPDLETIGAINVDTDIERALENNYNIRISKKQMANARSATVRETQQKTYDNQKQTASTSVKNAYNNLILAKADYEQASESYELEKSSLSAAEARLTAGTITKIPTNSRNRPVCPRK